MGVQTVAARVSISFLCAGQAYDLHRSHPNSVRHAELKVHENEARRLLAGLQRQRAALSSWGRDPDNLPTISDAEFLRRVRDEGKFLIKVDGFALDVRSLFPPTHLQLWCRWLNSSKVRRDCSSRF